MEETAQSLPLASGKCQKAKGGKEKMVLEELRSSWRQWKDSVGEEIDGVSKTNGHNM